MREVWHEGKRVDNESGLVGGGKTEEQEVKTCLHYFTLYYLEW